MKSPLLFLIKIGVSVALLAVIVSQFDVGDALATMVQAHPLWMILGGCSYVSVVVHDAVRLLLFFRPAPPDGDQPNMVRFLHAVIQVSKVNLASLTVAVVGFGTVGSEAYKIAALKNHFGTYTGSAGAIIGIRVMSFLVMLLMCIGALAVLVLTETDAGFSNLRENLQLADWGSVGLWTVAAWGVATAIAVLTNRSARRWLDLAVSPFRDRPISRYMELVLICVFVEFTRLASLTAFMLAFDVWPGFWVALLISTSSSILMLLPISWNGLGVREFSVVGILAAFGVGLEVAAAIAFASRIIMLATSMLGLFFLKADPATGAQS